MHGIDQHRDVFGWCVLADAVTEVEDVAIERAGSSQAIEARHRLVAHHSVVMNPAYVHITKRSLAEQARVAERLAAQGVYSIGRYGRWTYCSIEDNLVEAKSLAAELSR